MLLFIIETENGHITKISVLYDAYHQTLLKYSRDILDNIDDAEDCVADTYETIIGILRNDPTKVGDPYNKQTRNLLITVSKNKALNMLRRSKKIAFDPLTDEDVVDDSNSPLDVINLQEARQLVTQAIRNMDEKYKQPLVLRYYHDLSNADIAKVLGITENHVAVRLRRGKSELRRVLSHEAR